MSAVIGSPLAAPAHSSGGRVKKSGLVVAVLALAAILTLPAAAGLPPAGQVMLAILAFSVIVWMTEALDYAVSAVVIMFCGAFTGRMKPKLTTN